MPTPEEREIYRRRLFKERVFDLELSSTGLMPPDESNPYRNITEEKHAYLEDVTDFSLVSRADGDVL